MYNICNKISSVMPLNFNVVDVCIVTIKTKPWMHAREVYKELKYSKNANVIKGHCSLENIVEKYQMSCVTSCGHTC